MQVKKQENDYAARGERRVQKSGKRLAVCIAAAVLMIGGTCIAAAYGSISRSTEKQMNLSEEQKKELEKGESVMSFPEASATDQGITISLQDCIVDDYGARLTFRFDGYELPEAASMEGYVPRTFPEIGVYEGISYGGQFYNGFYVPPGRGRVVKDEAVRNYQFADGTMEYTVNISVSERGALLNKPIRVEFKNICYEVAGMEAPDGGFVDVEGNWVLEWTLPGDENIDVYKADLENTVIGDTEAKLTYVELSPVSAKIHLDYPRNERTEIFVDEDGTEIPLPTMDDPPYLTGVKYKDGSTNYYAYIGGGGSQGPRGKDYYEVIKNGDQIVDVDQVEYLVFYKQEPADPDKPVDDDFYFVKVR